MPEVTQAEARALISATIRGMALQLFVILSEAKNLSFFSCIENQTEERFFASLRMTKYTTFSADVERCELSSTAIRGNKLRRNRVVSSGDKMHLDGGGILVAAGRLQALHISFLELNHFGRSVANFHVERQD